MTSGSLPKHLATPRASMCPLMYISAMEGVSACLDLLPPVDIYAGLGFVPKYGDFLYAYSTEYGFPRSRGHADLIGVLS